MNLPPYHNFPTLSSDNLVLRSIQTPDVASIINISFYDGKPASSIEQAIEMQERINIDYKDGNSIHWGIAEKQTNRLLGTCGYYRDFKNKTGEIGCILLPDTRGKGIMTQALDMIIKFGFETMELQRIVAITSAQNHRALKLVNQLGMTKSKELPDDMIEFEILSKK